MKKRNGFVSNSSSSSFIVIGKETSKENINNFENVYMKGNDRGEGTDYFLLTKEMKDSIGWDWIHLSSFHKFLVEYGRFGDEGDNSISKKNLLELLKDIPDYERVEFFNIEKSYHSIDSFAEFKEYYYED